MNLLGKCFDRADWETITGGTGAVAKQTFITVVTVRNHAPSLRAWLEFWRIDELLEMLEMLGNIFFYLLHVYALTMLSRVRSFLYDYHDQT